MKRNVEDIFDMLEKMFDGNFAGGYKFSNNKRTNDSIIDVNETDNHLYITIQAGANEEDIFIDVKEDILSLRILLGDGEYKRAFSIPLVEPESLEKTYNNGILDISLMKQKKLKPKTETKV